MNGWSLDSVQVRYRGAGRSALESITLELPRQAFTAIIGPNGAGKSTLAHALIGTVALAGGTVCLEGRQVTEWSRRELARSVGVVAQLEHIPPTLTIRELVEMGRYPHLGAWQRVGALDCIAIESALHSCDLVDLAGRSIGTLSGGERQRARLARALAQEPSALVLDEPTQGLDVGHEMALFELLRHAAAGGTTVVLVTHHVNLAARYADRLVLMHQGRIHADGTAAEVLTPSILGAVYGWDIAVTPHPGPGPDTGRPQITPLARDRDA